jgi:hypothetical protein
LVHVRKADGECVGCIEVGLFEIVKALVLDEERRRVSDGVEGREDALRLPR